MARPGTKKELVQEELSGDKAPLEGGTLGVPSMEDEPEKLVTLAGVQVTGSAARKTNAVDIPSKYYRVTRGGFVMYDGCRTEMKPGKILCDASVDVDLIRRQGIGFEECPAPDARPAYYE